MLEFIPLSFGLESLHPPMELPDAKIRELYVGLADRLRFTEFKLLGPQSGARMAESKNRFLTVGRDRVVFRDEFTSQTFPTFCEDVETVFHAVRATFQIPVLLHVKVLVRLLLPHVGEATAVESLHRGAFSGLGSALTNFSRPFSGMGMRLVFPPTQENHSTFHLRIEPYFRDRKMFFLENEAQFFDPLTEIAQLSPRLQEAYDFLKQQAGPFLNATLTEDGPSNPAE